MEKIEWIMYACAAVWAGIGFYLFILARRQAVLSRRLRQMEALQEIGE